LRRNQASTAQATRKGSLRLYPPIPERHSPAREQPSARDIVIRVAPPSPAQQMLHSSLELAEAPDFSPQQLADLTRSVEQKKQQLEDDIQAYIRSKQGELRSYEREVPAGLRKLRSNSADRISSSSGTDPWTALRPFRRVIAMAQPPFLLHRLRLRTIPLLQKRLNR
jgi:hypothetical protein